MIPKKDKLSSAIILLLALTLCIVTSCEKHDGIQYFKSKCLAELNGKTLIDQTPFNIGPNSINTPSLVESEYTIEFYTSLKNERRDSPLYAVKIKLFVNDSWEYLTRPQAIKYIKIGESEDEPTSWDYIEYCLDNKISYATILSYTDYKNEIVKDGTFEFTSYNKEKRTYNGKFTLHFSEGTLNGEFLIQ